MTSTEHHRDDRDADDRVEDAAKDAVTGGATRRVVRSALFEYRDHETGARRIAVRGDVVELSAEDVRRGERVEALADEDHDEHAELDGLGPVIVAPRTPDQPEPAGRSRLEQPDGAVAPTGDLDAGDPAVQSRTGEQGGRDRDGDGQVDQPRKVESKARWVDYAVSAKGADRGEAEALSKDELIDRYGRD